MKAGQIYYERRGRGAPLLLIQGMASTHLHWGSQFMEALAKDFDCVIYDHRGTGYSNQALSRFSIRDLADDAVHLLDSLGWVRAHVFGVSMGGFVAQRIVLDHPHRVDRLILGCTTTDGQSMIGTPATDEPAQPAPTNVESAFRAAADKRGLEHGAGWTDYRLLADRLPISAHASLLQMDALLRHDVNADLWRIGQSTLVIHGDHDLTLPAAAGRALAEAIPNSQFTELPAGHLFWLDAPDVSAHTIRSFIAG